MVTQEELRAGGGIQQLQQRAREQARQRFATPEAQRQRQRERIEQAEQAARVELQALQSRDLARADARIELLLERARQAGASGNSRLLTQTQDKLDVARQIRADVEQGFTFESSARAADQRAKRERQRETRFQDPAFQQAVRARQQQGFSRAEAQTIAQEEFSVGQTFSVERAREAVEGRISRVAQDIPELQQRAQRQIELQQQGFSREQAQTIAIQQFSERGGFTPTRSTLIEEGVVQPTLPERLQGLQEFARLRPASEITDPFARFLATTGVVQPAGISSIGEPLFLTKTQPIPQVVEAGLMGQFALGGAAGFSLVPSVLPKGLQLQRVTQVGIRGVAKDQKLIGVGVAETRLGEILRKLKLPKLAKNFDKRFVLAEQNLGKVGNLQISKGGIITEEGRVVTTSSLSQELTKLSKGNVDFRVGQGLTKVEADLLASRIISASQGDITAVTGTVFTREGAAAQITGIITRIPSKTGLTGEVISTQRVAQIAQQAIQQLPKVTIPAQSVTGLGALVQFIQPQEVVEESQLGLIQTPQGVQQVKIVEAEIQQSGVIPITKEEVKQASKQKVRQASLQLQQQIQQEETLLRTGELIIPQEQSRLLQLTGVASITRQRQRQIQRQIQQQPPITTTPRPPTVLIPPIPPITIPEEELFGMGIEVEPSVLVKGFDVFVKRKGKFVKVSTKALPKALALKLGATETKQTLAATFKLEPSQKRVKPSKQQFTLGQEFRTFKVVKGKQIPLDNIFIQKRQFRLGTKSERKAIQRAKKETENLMGLSKKQSKGGKMFK